MVSLKQEVIGGGSLEVILVRRGLFETTEEGRKGQGNRSGGHGRRVNKKTSILREKEQVECLHKDKQGSDSPRSFLELSSKETSDKLLVSAPRGCAEQTLQGSFCRPSLEISLGRQ